ncbi:transmembrane protein, putative (macronuclear) [Tetrahymena thermophila SB210]|uniref:Transmembrane protein 107 n=1 Tax=Tetrahymena thermophila (strain SB210) TaxID=312017 RepID=Q22AP0_TETTS|nr:transmembrane protein, putative [Tetrahymena thermophila SB210]EAR82354.2 transmembrane protein, putative [Tetrahymena thermophila SB210]|eukprot:XP_001030017.2 transmembrane protein, putative [Tetrahymena thermophila SB210]
MSSASILIPSKFIAIILHVIISGCILANYEDNILSANINKLNSDGSTNSQWSTAQASIVAAMVTSEIFLFIEIIILFIGINMYCDKLNILQTIGHSIGVILYSWFTLDSWMYNEIWSPWFFFSFCPFAGEIYQAVSSLLYYKRYRA